MVRRTRCSTVLVVSGTPVAALLSSAAPAVRARRPPSSGSPLTDPSGRRGHRRAGRRASRERPSGSHRVLWVSVTCLVASSASPGWSRPRRCSSTSCLARSSRPSSPGGCTRGWSALHGHAGAGLSAGAGGQRAQRQRGRAGCSLELRHRPVHWARGAAGDQSGSGAVPAPVAGARRQRPRARGGDRGAGPGAGHGTGALLALAALEHIGAAPGRSPRALRPWQLSALRRLVGASPSPCRPPTTTARPTTRSRRAPRATSSRSPRGPAPPPRPRRPRGPSPTPTPTAFLGAHGRRARAGADPPAGWCCPSSAASGTGRTVAQRAQLAVLRRRLRRGGRRSWERGCGRPRVAEAWAVFATAAPDVLLASGALRRAVEDLADWYLRCLRRHAAGQAAWPG